MKRGILILTVAFVICLRPSLSRAETHVYVSFSVGGAVVIGAGVVFWGFSYTSQVSERKPSEENPGLLTSTASATRTLHAVQPVPQPIPQFLSAGERTRADFTPVTDSPHAVSSIELPLLVFRW